MNCRENRDIFLAPRWGVLEVKNLKHQGEARAKPGNQLVYNYINLRRSLDCLLLCLAVWMGVCLCVSYIRFIRFALGSCYAVHINALSIS